MFFSKCSHTVDWHHTPWINSFGSSDGTTCCSVVLLKGNPTFLRSNPGLVDLGLHICFFDDKPSHPLLLIRHPDAGPAIHDWHHRGIIYQSHASGYWHLQRQLGPHRWRQDCGRPPWADSPGYGRWRQQGIYGAVWCWCFHLPPAIKRMTGKEVYLTSQISFLRHVY